MEDSRGRTLEVVSTPWRRWADGVAHSARANCCFTRRFLLATPPGAGPCQMQPPPQSLWPQVWSCTVLLGRLHPLKARKRIQKGPLLAKWPFPNVWWWGGTLRQTYVTQRLRTAANSSGKVRNPAPTANNPTSSARPRSSAKCLSQDASSIPVCGIEPTSATPDRLAWHHSAEPAPGRTACFRSKRRKNASIRSADPWPVSSLAPKR